MKNSMFAGLFSLLFEALLSLLFSPLFYLLLGGLKSRTEQRLDIFLWQVCWLIFF